MGSFLKRISPAFKLNNAQSKNNSHIYFELDEPDFLLERKFSKRLVSDMAHNHTTHDISCSNCGNVEFSHQANFCRICGIEYSHK